MRSLDWNALLTQAGLFTITLSKFDFFIFDLERTITRKVFCKLRLLIMFFRDLSFPLGFSYFKARTL